MRSVILHACIYIYGGCCPAGLLIADRTTQPVLRFQQALCIPGDTSLGSTLVLPPHPHFAASESPLYLDVVEDVSCSGGACAFTSEDLFCRDIVTPPRSLCSRDFALDQAAKGQTEA